MKTSGQNHKKVCIVTYLIFVIQVYGGSVTITQYPQYPTTSSTAWLTCHIPSFTGGAEWLRNGFRMTVCQSGLCIPPSRPGYQFSADATTMNVTISSLNITLDETTWTCAHNGGVDIGYYNLIVYIPVGSVELKNGTNLSLIESQSAVLVCETDACRPSAAIYWMKNGINITDSSTYLAVVGLSRGRFVSIGTLNYTGQRGDDGSLLTCGAYNGLGSVKTVNLAITIYYPPSIEELTRSYKVIEHEPLNVTCVVTSNPPANLIFWSPRGESSVNSILYFSSLSRYISGNYSCTAQNTMIPTVGAQQIGISTSQIRVDVLYPPSIQGLKSLYKVIEKQPLNVNCEVNSNPPADQISWSPRGEGSVTSILYFQSVSRSISGNYSCTAQNTMIPTVGTQQNGKIISQIQVDVMYSPTVYNFMSPVKVIQGQPLEVVCSADGNPPPQVSWNPAGEDRLNNSRLYYSAISMDKAGVHTCTATNNMVPTNGSPQLGSGYKELLIDVLCIPCVPQNVIVAVNGPDSVTLEWTSGIDFGHPQEFVIQYRIYPDGAWVKLDPIKETGSTKQSISIGYLQHKTTYEFNLQALNVKGPSDNISVIVTTTEIKECAFPVGAVVGSISGTLVACVCVVVIIFLQQKRQRKERRGDTYESVDTAGRISDKINTYDSLSQDKRESSGDIAYENTGAAISHSPAENITRLRDENMEMRSRKT